MNDWSVNVPKSFTTSGNRKSPGYAKGIEWISEIWSDLDSSLIANSFGQCGIASKDAAAYSSQLRHFLRTRQLVDVVELVNAYDEREEFNTLGDESSQHDVPDPDDSNYEHEE